MSDDQSDPQRTGLDVLLEALADGNEVFARTRPDGRITFYIGTDPAAGDDQ